MESTTIARSYADTLFELGRRDGVLEAFTAAFDTLVALLEAEPRLRAFIDAPAIDRAAKKQVLGKAFAGHFPDTFLNFLFVVIDKRRQRLLPGMARAFHDALDEHHGRIHVDVTLAREPDQELIERIVGRLSTFLDRSAVPHVRVDPGILGGIIVRYEDRVIDASLRRRLLALRRRLLAAEIGGSAPAS